jgi:hypothetical protein
MPRVGGYCYWAVKYMTSTSTNKARLQKQRIPGISSRGKNPIVLRTVIKDKFIFIGCRLLSGSNSRLIWMRHKVQEWSRSKPFEYFFSGGSVFVIKLETSSNISFKMVPDKVWSWMIAFWTAFCAAYWINSFTLFGGKLYSVLIILDYILICSQIDWSRATQFVFMKDKWKKVIFLHTIVVYLCRIHQYYFFAIYSNY